MSAEASKKKAEPDMFIESGTDQHETRLGYQADAPRPIIVFLVWAAAISGLVAYMVAYCFPDLALWGKP